MARARAPRGTAYRRRATLLAGMVLCLPRLSVAAYVIDQLLVGIHEDRAPESPIIQVVPTGSPIEVVERNGDFARVRTKEGVTGWVDASYVTDDKPARLALEELRTADAARAAQLETARATIERLQTELAEARKAAETPASPAPAPATAAESGSAPPEIRAELDHALEQNRLLQEEASLREMAAKRDAAAEIAALKAEVARLRGGDPPAGGASIASPDLRELQRLAEENRRLKSELGAATARRAEQGAADHAGSTWSWSIRSATVWEIAAIGFGILLAFFLGAFWIDASSRRRLGGFRL